MKSVGLAVLSLLIAAPLFAQSNPVPLVNQPLVPTSIAPGGSAFTLTLNGTGFVSGSIVNWNGSPRASSYGSASQLTATILASDIATPSTASVTVTNPSPGGGASNTLFFEITTSAPPVPSTSGTFGTDSEPAWIAVADLNGDGKQDLVTANVFDTVSVILGNGDGTFKAPTNYATGPTGQNPDSVAVGDVNEDGKPDLVVLNAESGKISVLLGNGDGTFQAATQFATGNSAAPQSMVLGDFNGDGNPDVALADLVNVHVLLGNGNGTFQSSIKLAAGNSPAAIVVGDFNGDDKLDLAVTSTNSNNMVSILLGNGNGTFQPSVSYPAGSQTYRLLTADFNGDGKLDLAVDNLDGNVSILLGNGDGTFQTPVSYTVGSTGAFLYAFAAADLDGDGNLDLEIGNSSGTPSVDILFGNGDGTFQPQVFYANAAPGTLVGADFNNDGRLDLAIVSRNYSGGTILAQVPSASLSTTALSFGSVYVSSTSTAQGLVLTNNGSAPLLISNIAIAGTNAGSFSQTNNCGSSLSPGANCSINVTFLPTAIGLQAASLNFTDNASGSPQSVPLKGSGTYIQLAPTILRFGNESVGAQSAPKKMTLRNGGPGTVNISSISFAGMNPGDFPETNTCSTRLAAGHSCYITVIFSPTAKGLRRAILQVSDNGGGSPQIVSLSGTGR
jgi:hypothetical protein